MLKEERIGVEFTTNEGYQVIVIDYINSKKVQVMFLDDYKYTTWTQWDVLKVGSLKNPFHKSVFGVGYLGTNENGQIPKCSINGTITREYQVWSGMMKRCYSDKFHESRRTYEKCTVWKRWHNFSLFLEDIDKIQDYEDWKKNDKSYDLNKDKYYAELGIETDCKEYNLQTVRFILDKENSKESAERSGLGKQIGIGRKRKGEID